MERHLDLAFGGCGTPGIPCHSGSWQPHQGLYTHPEDRGQVPLVKMMPVNKM